MAKFNLDEYELVEDRLRKFWKDYPNGRVNTEVVSSSADGTMVIVKAEMFMDFKDDKPVSTGLALVALEFNIGVSSRNTSFKLALSYAVVPFVRPSFEALAKPSISPSDIKS